MQIWVGLHWWESEAHSSTSATQKYGRKMLEIATTKDFSRCTVCTPPLGKEPKFGGVERMTITWRKIHNNKHLRAVRTEGAHQISQFCRWPSVSQCFSSRKVSHYLKIFVTSTFAMSLSWDFHATGQCSALGRGCWKGCATPLKSKRWRGVQEMCKHNSET